MHQKTVLDNGITITTEHFPHVRSISLGVWIVTGSRDENTAQNGIAHFIEHMFFKGTQKRSALDISKEIDSIGGVINALTSKEYTGLYVKVLDNNIDVAFDLLADIFLNSTFDPKEIEREREVIIQEIHLSEDTPDEHPDLRDPALEHREHRHPERDSHTEAEHRQTEAGGTGSHHLVEEDRAQRHEHRAPHEPRAEGGIDRPNDRVGHDEPQAFAELGGDFIDVLVGAFLEFLEEILGTGRVHFVGHHQIRRAG